MGVNRERDLMEKRQAIRCKYDDGITYDELVDIAQIIAEGFPRIKDIKVDNAAVFCTVESITGYSDWIFCVDFNNWGHIVGRFWTYTDNHDSNLHKQYAYKLSGAICFCLREKGITLDSLLDYHQIISNDDNVGTFGGLSYIVKESFWDKIFAKRRQITLQCSAKKLVGEHVYFVVALLKSWGFKNIKSYCKKDIGKDSNHYIYEVDHISIEGASNIRKGDTFPSNVPITIWYHDKLEITLPHNSKHYKHKNYIAVGDDFVDMGFSNIYERKIEDLLTGWITKDGSVQEVFVEINGKEVLMEKGKQYAFDTPIIISYHTFKYI